MSRSSAQREFNLLAGQKLCGLKNDPRPSVDRGEHDVRRAENGEKKSSADVQADDVVEGPHMGIVTDDLETITSDGPKTIDQLDIQCAAECGGAGNFELVVLNSGNTAANLDV